MERSVMLRIAGTVLILIGIVALGLALLSGEAGVALLVIVPIIYGTGALGALAILSIFAGMVLLFLSYAATAPPDSIAPADDGRTEPKVKREFGGIVFIGPIPIVFGSARSLKGSWMLAILAGLSLVFLLIFLFTLLR